MESREPFQKKRDSKEVSNEGLKAKRVEVCKVLSLGSSYEIAEVTQYSSRWNWDLNVRIRSWDVQRADSN